MTWAIVIGLIAGGFFAAMMLFVARASYLRGYWDGLREDADVREQHFEVATWVN